MKIKVLSVFILLLSFAVYDKYGTSEWNTNLVVMYYVIFHGFAVFWIWEIYKSTRNKLDRAVLIVLSLPFFLRIILTLLAIGKSRDEYNGLVSNSIIDYVTWIALACLLILIVWRKYQE